MPGFSIFPFTRGLVGLGPPQMWASVGATPARTGVPAWRGSSSTSAPAPQTGVGLTASTQLRQVNLLHFFINRDTECYFESLNCVCNLRLITFQYSSWKTYFFFVLCTTIRISLPFNVLNAYKVFFLWTTSLRSGVPVDASGPNSPTLTRVLLCSLSPRERSPARVERHERPGLQQAASLCQGGPGPALQLRRGLPHERHLR